ncbi:MAG: hypothetical protein NC131_03195 [Roseburia sp.]|nr:hypothetical protein [Roseburia sp.]
MKKKFFATAAVCVLSAACVFGVTACNNGGGSSNGLPDVGDSAKIENAADWKAAFEKTVNATNYSYTRVTQYLDFKYSEKQKVYVWGNEKFSDITLSDGSVQWIDYLICENNVTYDTHLDEYGKWNTYDYDCFWYSFDGELDIFSGFDSNSNDEFDGEKTLGDLFDEFVYKDGKYTANLKAEAYDGYISVPVSVKFNNEGYVSYFYMSYISPYENLVAEYVFYDYGTTDFKNVPAEARQAVEDYKAANN